MVLIKCKQTKYSMHKKFFILPYQTNLREYGDILCEIYASYKGKKLNF